MHDPHWQRIVRKPRLLVITSGAVTCMLIVMFVAMRVSASAYLSHSAVAIPSPTFNGVYDRFVVMTATLGGTAYDFDVAYGLPRQGVYLGTVNHVPHVAMYPDYLSGEDSRPHVDGLLVMPGADADGWDMATATRLMLALMPPDALSVRDVATSFGTTHIEQSASLAATFPAAAFTDLSGTTQVPAGVFHWHCEYNASGVYIRLCMIGIGQP